MTRHIVPDSRNTCGTARRACAGRCATPLVVTLTRLGALAAVSLAPATITAQQFVRERPPTLGAPAPLTVPAVRSARLPNGMALQVVAQRELPLVQVIVSFPGGSRLDGATPGIAAFTANMLDEGAGPRDAATLQAELAFLGAQLQTGADWDRLFVALKVPVRSLGPALDLLADVVRRPTFSAAEVRRQRDLRLANLLQQRDQPNALADLAFNAIVYPAGHPYHNSAGGDSASVAAFDSSAVGPVGLLKRHRQLLEEIASAKFDREGGIDRGPLQITLGDLRSTEPMGEDDDLQSSVPDSTPTS